MSATHPYSDRVEFAGEVFALLPGDVATGPDPIFFFPEGRFEGSQQMVVDDFDVVALFRTNFWLGSGSVRPYLALGAGVHFKDRERVLTREVRELPDGDWATSARTTQESTFAVASMFAAGFEVSIARSWDLRAEGRLPLPIFVGSVHTLGFAIGIAYTRD